MRRKLIFILCVLIQIDTLTFLIFGSVQVGGVLPAVLQRDAVAGRAVLGRGSEVTTQQTFWDTRYFTFTPQTSELYFFFIFIIM